MHSRIVDKIEVINCVVFVTATGRSECRKCSCGAGSDHFEEQSLWS